MLQKGFRRLTAFTVSAKIWLRHLLSHHEQLRLSRHALGPFALLILQHVLAPENLILSVIPVGPHKSATRVHTLPKIIKVAVLRTAQHSCILGHFFSSQTV